LERQLLVRCGEVLEPLGFRPVDLDCHIGGRSMVRIYIERAGQSSESQSPATSLEDCTQVSRLIGPILEADPGIPGGFDLEVSSPGLDRRLRLRPDFESAVGSTVKLKLVEKLEGRGANLTGMLVRVESDHIVIEIGKDEVAVPWQKIKQAVRVWDFSQHH